jgi:hypothetical protein
MKIRDVMEQERAALLGESLIVVPPMGSGVLPFSAVTEPEVLVRSPTFLRSVHPVRLETLPGRDRNTAFVQVCPSLGYKFLWVNSSNDRYREDYKTFLREFHKLSGEVPKGLDVDHLYNRDRAKSLGTPFIRTVLAEHTINISHGAGYEKSRSRSGLGAFGRDHTMDTITLMKLCGMPSPKKGQPLTAEMLAHVHLVAITYGMKVGDLEREIMDLMDVAAFRPCKR